MNSNEFLIVWSSIALLYTQQTVIGAAIEVPDDFLLRSEPYHQEPLRAKRQVKLRLNGTAESGTFKFQGEKNLFQNQNTKLTGTLKEQTDWARGFKPMHNISLRLDGQHDIFKNQRTQITGKGFAQRKMGTGFRPHNSYGAGVGLTQNLYKGRSGQLDAFGGYQRQWNTPSKHNAMGGLRWTF